MFDLENMNVTAPWPTAQAGAQAPGAPAPAPAAAPTGWGAVSGVTTPAPAAASWGGQSTPAAPAMGMAPQNNAAQGWALPDPPGDTVADLDWSLKNPYLAAASWDNTIRIWKGKDNFQSAETVLVMQEDTQDACLRCSWHDKELSLFYGTATGEVKHLPEGQAKPVSIGKHIGVITGLKWSGERSVLVTGSTDAECKLWDVKQNKAVATIDLPGKCVSLDCRQSVVAVALNDMRISLIDLRNTSYPVKTQKSRMIGNKGAQLTSISMGPSRDPISEPTFVVGSTYGVVEGRCGPNHGSWAAHVDESGMVTRGSQAYPCNCVKVSPYHKGAITGGSNGKLAFINLDKGTPPAKKAATATTAPVTALAIGRHDLYAVAVGCDWSKGLADETARKQAVEIWVKKFAPNEFG